MIDTAPVATAVARKFPDITTAVLSAALQGATAAVERKINNKH
jgi:hypothetical protein